MYIGVYIHIYKYICINLYLYVHLFIDTLIQNYSPFSFRFLIDPHLSLSQADQMAFIREHVPPLQTVLCLLRW